jgi:hypothetical protein
MASATLVLRISRTTRFAVRVGVFRTCSSEWLELMTTYATIEIAWLWRLGRELLHFQSDNVVASSRILVMLAETTTKQIVNLYFCT